MQQIYLPQIKTAQKQNLLNEMFWLRQYLIETRFYLADPLDMLYQGYKVQPETSRNNNYVHKVFRYFQQRLAEMGIDYESGVAWVRDKNKPKPKATYTAPAPAAQPKAYVSTLVPEPDEDDLPIGAELDPWNV